MDRRDMNLLKTVGLFAALNYVQRNNNNHNNIHRSTLHGMWIACHFMTPQMLGHHQSQDEQRFFQMFYLIMALENTESTPVDALQIPLASFLCLFCACVWFYLYDKMSYNYRFGVRYDKIMQDKQWWRLLVASVCHKNIFLLIFCVHALWYTYGFELYFGSLVYSMVIIFQKNILMVFQVYMFQFASQVLQYLQSTRTCTIFLLCVFCFVYVFGGVIWLRYFITY